MQKEREGGGGKKRGEDGGEKGCIKGLEEGGREVVEGEKIHVHQYFHPLLIPLMFSGTHGYMAPEVIKKGVQYTFTADWFSLGCVLYKLLRG